MNHIIWALLLVCFSKTVVATQLRDWSGDWHDPCYCGVEAFRLTGLYSVFYTKEGGKKTGVKRVPRLRLVKPIVDPASKRTMRSNSWKGEINFAGKHNRDTGHGDSPNLAWFYDLTTEDHYWYVGLHPCDLNNEENASQLVFTMPKEHLSNWSLSNAKLIGIIYRLSDDTLIICVPLWGFPENLAYNPSSDREYNYMVSLSEVYGRGYKTQETAVALTKNVTYAEDGTVISHVRLSKSRPENMIVHEGSFDPVTLETGDEMDISGFYYCVPGSAYFQDFDKDGNLLHTTTYDLRLSDEFQPIDVLFGTTHEYF